LLRDGWLRDGWLRDGWLQGWWLCRRWRRRLHRRCGPGQSDQVNGDDRRPLILYLAGFPCQHAPKRCNGNCVQQDGPHDHARRYPAPCNGRQTGRTCSLTFAIYVFGELQKYSIRISQYHKPAWQACAPPTKSQSHVTKTAASTQQPDALEHFDVIASRMAGRSPALFLDYDGTLVPLARRPELAIAPKELCHALSRLAELMPVAVVSGRGRADIEAMLDVKGIAYAGSHGFDIVDAQGRDLSGDIGAPYRPALEDAACSLAPVLEPISGAFVEDKVYSLAIHYREVAPERHDAVRAAVDAEAARHAGLKRTGGKMIHELRPDIEWNKGTAVIRVMEALGLTAQTAVPFYLGDDETDEDAFRAIEHQGIGIRVGEPFGPTHAHFSLHTPDDVSVFLERLATLYRAS